MKQELLVYYTEFQVEPTPAVLLTETDGRNVPRWLPDTQVMAAVESLLLALRFRNWLGDSEKNFLDLLAPEHSVTFLIHNREYLHPEGVSLFPMDLVETALNGGGQAIFTHRYEPQTSSDHDCYKVHTARFSPLDRDEWILGTLGPDRLFGGPDQEDRFGRLVEMFRRAWLATEDLEGRIATKLESSNPVMLINRASGRVLTASQQLADLMRQDLKDIADTEYSELSRQLAARTNGMKLQLENLSTDPIQLCLATLSPNVKEGGDSLSGSLIADFFIHTMRNKLAGITAAASHLGLLAEEVDAREEVELSEIVLGEATQLDRELDRLLTLVAYDRLPRKEVPVGISLSEAIDHVLTTEGSRAAIDHDQMLAHRTFESPPPALSLLFEAVLFSHLNHQRQESRTNITFEECPLYTEVRLLTEMARPLSEPALNRHWQACARRLAGLMACELTQENSANGAGFASTIRIPHNV